jgi:predicted nuclease of predicted toxin-antitoxin system
LLHENLIDAQLSPNLAEWINISFNNVEAISVRSVGLSGAKDKEIFNFARDHQYIVMTKDSDFIRLIEQYGSPPQLIWITCGNTSNRKMISIFSKTLTKVLDLIHKGENIIEISDI